VCSPSPANSECNRPTAFGYYATRRTGTVQRVRPAVASPYLGSLFILTPVRGCREVQSTTTGPQVSVVIRLHRREQYIVEAVQSVLDSTIERTAYEILVVTDGLSKELRERLRELGVQILESGTLSSGEMLGIGVSSARGEVVAFLDDDDCFRPEKLATLLQVFSDPRVVYYHHGLQRVDLDRRPVAARAELAPVYSRFTLPLSRGDAAWIRRKGGMYNVSSIAVRRSALVPQIAALRPVTNGHDFALLLLLKGPGDVVIDGSRVLVDYRTHVSMGTHDFTGGQVSDVHVRFLEGTVRSFEWLCRVAPTPGARSFARCRAESYETLLATTTGRFVSGNPLRRTLAVRAAIGNLREGDVRSAAILSFLAFLSLYSRQWAVRFYIPLKRTELASIGLATAAMPSGPSTGASGST